MKHIFGIATSALLALASPGLADGAYDLFGSHGDKWGELSFEETVNEHAVWVWPNAEGDTTFFFDNPKASQGDWSRGTYDGYYTINAPDHLTDPCGRAISDPYGNAIEQWGMARMIWASSDEFSLTTWGCDGADIYIEVTARYNWQQSQDIPPAKARVDLQSNMIPVSMDDPAYTVQQLNMNPAIYLDIEFADGTTPESDYLKLSAHNIVFDDVTGDPHDLIEINYWDIDGSDLSLGKYAAQLTSTGKGVGTAELFVSFRNAPDVTASVSATVVSAAPMVKVPVSASLNLRSYTLPLNQNDPAYTVSGLDPFPAIYVSAQFADESQIAYSYQKDFADNVILDDVSGDPFDLIKIVEWPIDNNNLAGPQYAGQLTSTGRGVGTASLLLSFRNAPHVTASIAVNVVSGAQ